MKRMRETFPCKSEHIEAAMGISVGPQSTGLSAEWCAIRLARIDVNRMPRSYNPRTPRARGEKHAMLSHGIESRGFDGSNPALQ